MEPVLIGYFPKKIEYLASLKEPARMLAVCSVSECISKGPENWVNAWLHNEFLFFDSVSTAERIVPPAERELFHMFGYKILPVGFSTCGQTAITFPVPSVSPLSAEFSLLGYDVVSRSTGTGFECSPLSCNRMEAEIGVNRFCLLSTLSEAIRMAESFVVEEPEPGPYFVVEVWGLGDGVSLESSIK